MQTKYIFVTGGVVSSLGKGITAASLGRLLKARGYKVTMQKLDPYINMDPGTMSPYQHGEVFVTEDGAETDLDLGHYERFIDENLTRYSNLTTGQVYWSVLNKERKGEYLGSTVQVIPHVTDEIKQKIMILGEDSDIVISEIGGTVGDIESLPFLEAIRQMKYKVGEENVMYVHVTLIPYLQKAGELKTKPTQHSVKQMREIGIQPDVVITRSPSPINEEIKQKIGLFCNLHPSHVFQNVDVDSLYEIPLHLEEDGLAAVVLKTLGLEDSKPDLEDWKAMIEREKNRSESVTIALVGKYVELRDAYISVYESLDHAGIKHNVNVQIKWVSSEEVTPDNVQDILCNVQGIVVPGGFGDRGVEGKILAANYARTKGVAYLGLCLGMQIACIEFAREVLGLEKANSSEFDPFAQDPIIHIMESQKNVKNLGGSMRLGAYTCTIKAGTLASRYYEEREVFERHRHRYEFNNAYRKAFEEAGIVFSGLSPDGELVEMIELRDHPFYVACQFHPEFRSRPNRPHPLFDGFLEAATHSDVTL